MSKILIADDDASIRLVLSQAFTRRGHQVRATGAAATLWKWVSEGEGDLVVTDVIMPDENVFEVLPRIRKARPNLPVIVMSAQNTVLTAISAAETGAYDYLPKPFDLDRLIALAERALAGSGGDMEGARARARAVRDERLPMIGRSAVMQEVYRTVSRLVGSDLTVLVTGESGTGKELVGRVLHDLGPRRHGRFVAVNLAATPRDRMERELFGDRDWPGRLAEADGGTLFLDEIGDMALDAQARLLRVLDGSQAQEAKAIDIRIVAATNRDLRDLVGQGLFREDLFFRLDVAPVRLPPLRDRLEDVPDLAQAFLLRAQREGLAAKRLDDGAVARLQRHSWPGNVRELENLIRRLCALHAEPVITADAVDRELAGKRRESAPGDPGLGELIERRLAHDLAGGLPASGLYDRVIAEVEAPLIRLVLAATGGNQLRAAEVLGLNRNTLRKKLREHGLRAKM
jgi:two-component system nitrogen regulation response regulator GlnG